MSSVPYSKFSTETVDPSQRRDFWIEGMGALHDVSPMDKSNPQYSGSMEVWDAGGVSFIKAEQDSSIMDHRRSKHNRSGENDFLAMTIIRQGGARRIQDGRLEQLNLDEAHLFNFGCDRRIVSGRVKTESAVIPYDAIGYEPGQHASSLILPYSSASGYIVSELFSMILEQLPTADVEGASDLAGMLSGTLRSLISADADEGARMQAISARRAVMHRFVIDNIDDLSLNVGTLCRKFGVSRATVFRDFEPGGLRSFMTLHRLNRALDEIVNGPAMRGRIALIAERWGFSSPAHFSRAFREYFGFSPSDAVGVGREARESAAHGMDLNRDWMLWMNR